MYQQSKIARRTFFAALGGAAAAGVAVKLASKPALAPVAEPLKEASGDSYRLSEHVKKYYKTTTI